MDVCKMLGALLVDRSMRSPGAYKRIDRAVTRPRNPRYSSLPSNHGDVFSGPSGSVLREAMRRHGRPLHGWHNHPEPPFPGAPGNVVNGSAQAILDDACHDSEGRAVLLLQAMIQATKADGQVDREEEANIVNQLPGLSAREAEFLREEFARPVDVQGLAQATPLGMEADVYAASLAAIHLDHTFEGEYLRELAHCLRLPNDVVAEIHRQIGAPSPRWRRVRLRGATL
ncbi:MAG: tellurite resistance TerB family protein [Planctomycetales bacterium]|nr:tellurite resistance TerB family protein [Planctomycetales bacterium]